MILGFKEQFKEKILAGTKIHTIRQDVNKRWHIGRKIQFATDVRTKEYSQFTEGECTDVVELIIYPYLKRVYIFLDKSTVATQLTEKEVALLAKNDGFENAGAFFDWFAPLKHIHHQLIFWQGTREIYSR